MKQILTAVLLAFSLPVMAVTQEVPLIEGYIATEGNAFLRFSNEDCTISEFKEKFPLRVYAEEENGTQHEGCFVEDEGGLHAKFKDSDPRHTYSYGKNLVSPTKPEVQGVLAPPEVKGEF